MTVEIEFDTSWQEGFCIPNRGGWPMGKLGIIPLGHGSRKAFMIPEFEGLLAPKIYPSLTPLPHQLEMAKQVVENMNGKAILADEVGLGKTIEAGLILKEYMIRGLVKKALILVPASLVSQWVIELNSKFHIPAVPQRKSYVWDQYDVVISSIDTAKRNPHKEIIYKQDYDLVIIDEAHKLKIIKQKTMSSSKS